MLLRASAVKFGETGQEMWPDITLRLGKLIAVLDLDQIKPEWMSSDTARATYPAFQNLFGPFDGTLTRTDPPPQPTRRARRSPN